MYFLSLKLFDTNNNDLISESGNDTYCRVKSVCTCM